MTFAHFEQQFLNDLNDKLWKSADKLRSNLDAANYKHIVLGLVFLKYVSDAFADKMKRLTAQLKEQFAESDKLEAQIKKNLGALGYWE